jgi:hypothetical protein
MCRSSPQRPNGSGQTVQDLKEPVSPGQKSNLTTSRLPVNARSILPDTIIKPKSSTSMMGSQNKGLKRLKLAKTYSKIAHIAKMSITRQIRRAHPKRPTECFAPGIYHHRKRRDGGKQRGNPFLGDASIVHEPGRHSAARMRAPLRTNRAPADCVSWDCHVSQTFRKTCFSRTLAISMHDMSHKG